MSNINIPLESHINTADDHIIHEIDSQTKDCMNKKNTLKFKKCLSPMWYKNDNGLFTTSGHTIKKAGNYLVDEHNNSYSVDISYVIKNNIDLTNLINGECCGAWCIDSSVYSVWKTKDSAIFVISDLNNNVTSRRTINMSDVISFDAQIIPGTINGNSCAVIVANDTANHSFIKVYLHSSGALVATLNVNNYLGEKLYTYHSANSNIAYIGTDDVDVRKRMTYTFTYGATTPIVPYIAGFGCIGSNGLITGEPLPITVTSNTIANISRKTAFESYGFNFLDNGIGYFNNTKTTSSDAAKLAANEALKEDSGYNITGTGTDGVITAQDVMTWGNVNFSKKRMCWIFGWSIKENIALTVSPNYPPNISPDFDIYTTEKSISGKTSLTAVQDNIFQIIDFSDGFGNTEWNSASSASISSGFNPFPYCYSIFNRAESKGVYWNYGPGWAKSYLRTVHFGAYKSKRIMEESHPTMIVSVGLSSSLNEVSFRNEYLSTIKWTTNTWDGYDIRPTDTYPQARANFYTYKEDSNTTNYPSGRNYMKIHEFNPDVFESGMVWVDNIGADNLPNHSILNSIPFNVDVDPANNIKDQYFQGNYLSTSMKGTLINSASLNAKRSSIYFNSGHTYSIYTDNRITIISDNATFSDLKLEKVADYIYKTNTLIGDNLFIDSKDRFYGLRGFIPFNGEEVISLKELAEFSSPSDNENTDGNAVYYSTSGYNVNMTDYENRATSYLLPAIEMPIVINSDEVENFTFQLITNKHELSKPLLYNQFTSKDEGIDHFYNYSLNSTSIEYQDTKKVPNTPQNTDEALYGVKTYDVDKAGQVWWITSDIQIFPIGIASKISGINYLNSTIELADDYTVRLYRNNNTTFINYNPNTAVYKGSTIFTIYGYNYSFDGQAIYYLGSGDDTSQMSFACYAIGMQFLANSGTEAYFYSSFEKRIYLFTGSVTLQAADLLSREGSIVDSLYSSLEQILYLLTDEGNIIARSQNDMCMITNVDKDNYHFEATDTGMILQGNFNYLRYRLWKTNETEFLPIEYETEYLGKNDSLFKVSNIDITLFRNDSSPIEGNLIFCTINDLQKTNETIKFKVSKTDFMNSVLTKIRLVPKNNVMKAFSLNINSNDFISIADICISIDEVSNNTNAPAKLHK